MKSRPGRATPRPLLQATGLSLLLLLAGCAVGPAPSSGGASRPSRDGADANPPANLASVPDAEPRTETIRSGGANKPYAVLGRSYTPLPADSGYRETGLASWYGRKFHGLPTSSGEPYDMYAMTAAHTTLPIPSYARVRNPANGREVVVRINDRGPFHDGRVIDLSYTAAWKLDLLRGVAPVEVERITPVQIASGSWRRGNVLASDVPGASPVGAPRAVRVPAAAVAYASTREAERAARPAPAAPVRPAVAAASASADTASSAEPSAIAVFMPAPAPSDVDAAYAAVPLAAVARSADRDEAEPPPRRSLVVTVLSPLPPRDADPTSGSPAVIPATAPSATASSTAAVPGFWVQLGAFARLESATALQQRANAAGYPVAILEDGILRRVQNGPFASRDAARTAATRMAADLGLTPLVVEHR